MRGLSIFGIVLVVFGILALGLQGVTFFTHERVVDAGPLQFDWAKPHTIILNPIVGIVSVIAGLVMIVADRRSAAA